MNKTLTTYEKDIIDQYILKINPSEITLGTFNYALSNTLPTWRSEMLVDTNDNSFVTDAYTDYIKDFLEHNNKA